MSTQSTEPEHQPLPTQTHAFFFMPNGQKSPEWPRLCKETVEAVAGGQGLNSIEFQQGFQQSTLHSVWLNALLKITLNSLLKFN